MVGRDSLAASYAHPKHPRLLHKNEIARELGTAEGGREPTATDAHLR